MNDKFIITDLDGWLNLPKIEIPSLKSESEKGSVYEVKKVGFVIVDKEKCKKEKIKAQDAPGNKCALPTAVVLFDGIYELCSLPIDLTEWVQQCVAMAHSGMNAFPSKVEFGVLNGRTYGEML